MGISVQIDFDKELSRIKREVVKIANASVSERTAFATEALRSTTPVDTGYAASRWSHTIEKLNGEEIGSITNDAPYIEKLNRGHSKQAPPFFIETVLLTIGELSAPVDFSE